MKKKHSKSGAEVFLNAFPPTGIERLVATDIALRQQKGVKKYGTTVASATLGLLGWLKHAYEESLDLPIYLKRAIIELELNHSKPPHPTPGEVAKRIQQTLKEFAHGGIVLGKKPVTTFQVGDNEPEIFIPKSMIYNPVEELCKPMTQPEFEMLQMLRGNNRLQVRFCQRDLVDSMVKRGFAKELLGMLDITELGREYADALKDNAVTINAVTIKADDVKVSKEIVKSILSRGRKLRTPLSKSEKEFLLIMWKNGKQIPTKKNFAVEQRLEFRGLCKRVLWESDMHSSGTISQRYIALTESGLDVARGLDVTAETRGTRIKRARKPAVVRRTVAKPLWPGEKEVLISLWKKGQQLEHFFDVRTIKRLRARGYAQRVQNVVSKIVVIRITETGIAAAQKL